MAGEGGEAEASAREALRTLVGAARAWLELHRDVGTFGLPSALESPAFAPDGEGGPHLASVVALAPPLGAPAEGGTPAPAGAFAPNDDREGPDEPAPPGPRFAADAPSAGAFAANTPPAGAFAAAAPSAGAFAAAAPSAGTFAPSAPTAGTLEPGAADAGAYAAAGAGGASAPAGEANAGARPGASRLGERAASQPGLFSLGVDGGPIRPGLPLGVEVPEGVEARLTRLQVLAGEAAGCTRCGLHAGRTKSVFARGNPRARIMFIGEGPGADEDAQGQPFVGKSGQLLDRMVAAMGLRQDEIYIANVVKCRPPQNRKPEPEEMSTCVPYLAEQIALIEPEVLIALGGTAVEGLLGGRVAITRARGQWRLYRATIPVMPTYHPAYLLRNPPAKREVWDDLRAVLQRLGRSVPGKGA